MCIERVREAEGKNTFQARFALEVLFEGVEGSGILGGVQSSGSHSAIRIANEIVLSHEAAGSSKHGFAVMEWESSARSDMIADATVACLMQVHSSMFQ